MATTEVDIENFNPAITRFDGFSFVFDVPQNSYNFASITIDVHVDTFNAPGDIDVFVSNTGIVGTQTVRTTILLDHRCPVLSVVRLLVKIPTLPNRGFTRGHLSWTQANARGSTMEIFMLCSCRRRLIQDIPRGGLRNSKLTRRHSLPLQAARILRQALLLALPMMT